MILVGPFKSGNSTIPYWKLLCHTSKISPFMQCADFSRILERLFTRILITAVNSKRIWVCDWKVFTTLSQMLRYFNLFVEKII